MSIWRLVQVPGISFKDFVTLDNHVMVAPDLNDHVIIDALIMPDENDTAEITRTMTATPRTMMLPLLEVLAA